MKIFTYFDRINGKDTWFERATFERAIKKLSDGRHFVYVETFFSRRSVKQNKTYWGLAYKLILNELITLGWKGIDEISVHEMCKENCLPEEYVLFLKKKYDEETVNKNTGEVLEVPFRLTTKYLDTKQGAEYFENIRLFWEPKLNFTIPDPDPRWRELIEK